MQEADGEVASRVQHAVEVRPSGSMLYKDKAACLYNTDQTAVYIDMQPTLTIDFVGARDVDVVADIGPNLFRASVLFSASARGRKLPAIVAFAGKPNGLAHREVRSHKTDVVAIVQRHAYTDERVMMEWIDEVWRPDLGECRYLLLDSLKVHKMDAVATQLAESNTEVDFIPPGLTGVWQPIDVAENLHSLYMQHHIDFPTPATASDRRRLIVELVAQAWDAVPAHTINNRFVKCKLLPIGPRDANGIFRVVAPITDAPALLGVQGE
ncbi:hypothetical protein PybrP1_003397 [[Pythium] brassicae (nom. inval.)]|nr:hypothetical protein PybrP1_003397 [[Pythium] brassicae (nom. inval.)]